MNTALANRILEEHAAVADALPGDRARRDRRRQALQRFAAQGVPTHRDENWRYANLHALDHLKFAPSGPADSTDGAIGALPASINGYQRYVFVDGHFAPALSAPATSAVSFGPANQTTAPASDDARMALLNEAFATDGVDIVAADIDQPLRIEAVFLAGAGAQPRASYPRLSIEARENCKVALIERHIGLGSAVQLVNGVVNVKLARGAAADHYRLQQTGSGTTWIDTLDARVGADASYRLHLANLGALSARSTLHIALEGERASMVLNAVSVPDVQQTHDVYAVIEHAAADTTTDERFRGIAAERARVGFNGKMIVRAGASRAVSRQSLRGLLAGAHAEVDVRPQLEIYTDDVQCSHGATAGKLDDAMLFYLLSRGLDRETAQLLLKWAFLEDVVAKIDLPELRKQIEQTLAAQMKADALQELL